MEQMGRSKGKRSGRGPVLLLLILIIAVGLMAFMRTSYFSIKDIRVQGNSFVDKQEIMRYSGISPGMNILTVKLKEAEEAIKTHPYILDTQVQRIMPDTIEITVKERDLVGYIPYLGSYLLVDSEGMVISATARVPVEGLPVYKGIKVQDFQANEILDIDNIQIFDKIIYISKCIANNLAGYAPIEVNIENPEDIIIRLGDRFALRVGDTEDLDYKLEYSNTILEKLYSQEVGGEIDVTHGGNAFFRPW
jgi:cell division protein FtsQ